MIPNLTKLNERYLKLDGRYKHFPCNNRKVNKVGSKMNNPLYDKLFGVHSRNDDTFLYLINGQTITYRNFLANSRRIANTLLT